MFHRSFGRLLVRKMNRAFEESHFCIAELMNGYHRRAGTRAGKGAFRVLDVGCGDGTVTEKILNEARFDYEAWGLDISGESRFGRLRKFRADLERGRFPLGDGAFDIVFSSQVIEHMLDKDLFIQECRRVLKRSGLLIIATENIASIDNIFSMLLGQEPLVQNASQKRHVNSVLSPHYMQPFTGKDPFGMHKNVCSYFGLKRIIEINGFRDIRIKSLGNIGRVFERIAPIYNRIIIAYGVKD